MGTARLAEALSLMPTSAGSWPQDLREDGVQLVERVVRDLEVARAGPALDDAHARAERAREALAEIARARRRRLGRGGRVGPSLALLLDEGLDLPHRQLAR